MVETYAKRGITVLLVTATILMVGPVSARPQILPTDPPPAEFLADQAPAAAPVQAPLPSIRPRMEVFVPSARKLVAEVHRSNTGLFVDYLGDLVEEVSSLSSDGTHVNEAKAIAGAIDSWPDVAIDAATFAPDLQGRSRWGVRFGMPLVELHKHIKEILKTDAAKKLFEGISISTNGDGFCIEVPTSKLAFLREIDANHSCILSHNDLELAAEPFRPAEESHADGEYVFAARLNLTQTEQDSGETFFSKFSAVTGVEYTCRVDEGGDWVDSVRLYWPPVSGMAIKAAFGRVKHSFYVPDESFGAAVFSSMMAPAMLEQMVGFGAQAMVDQTGQMIVVGQETTGPLASHIKDDMCLTILPGMGFLPAPDMVVQCRARHEEKLADSLREATEKINAIHREQDQEEPWHECTVRDRAVFWRNSGVQTRGMMMPLVMRPVIFTAKETDDKGKLRDFVVIGWTSTSPESLVRRWLDLPRTSTRRYLPSESKTNGQIWMNTDLVYRWVQPYLNISISAASADVLLPSESEARSKLTDATVTARVTYEGLFVDHKGPVPLGVGALPAMYSAASMENHSGSSDLARERLARQRLEVLYHHCKLFRKDVGRWPAEVAELDGYVDFAGNSYLLRLQVSSGKKWSRLFDDMFELGEEEDAENQEEGLYDHINDDLYVIEWGRDKWTLGIAPNTFEHIEKLYIDQDGVIHCERINGTDQPTEGHGAEPSAADPAVAQ